MDLKINFMLLSSSILLCFIYQSFCCLYESQQVETSLNNAISIESVSSAVECILECKSLKKTPFYGENKECYCLDSIQHNSDNTSVNGTIFKKVTNAEEGTANNTKITPSTVPYVDQLVSYQIRGTLSMFCGTDEDTNCEFYGNLKFEIGNRPENQNIEVWSRSGSQRISKQMSLPFALPFSAIFNEYESFATDVDKYVVLDGQIKEWDSNGFDLIADLSGQLFAVKNIFGKSQTKKVSKTDAYAEVTVKIIRV
ncbi:uncharacterized protein [Clytia hemisphaerica]